MNSCVSASAIRSHTLSLLLYNRMHSGLDLKQRALRLSKCCKTIRDKTKDKYLYDACRSIIKTTSEGKYFDVVKAIELTEYNYLLEYKK